RPPNSFMIYRSERHNELVKEYRGGNKVISGIIAKEWHNMSAEVKKKYEDLAAIKKREHELLYPNYKFMPKR
ncbi:high mobility group box domain-containing protein, partial [Coemansia spiralis]